MSSLGMLVALRPAHLSFSGSRWAGKVEIVVRVTVGNSHLAIYCKGDGEPVSRLHSVNSVRHTATCRGFTAEDAESAERKKVESGKYGRVLEGDDSRFLTPLRYARNHYGLVEAI